MPTAENTNPPSSSVRYRIGVVIPYFQRKSGLLRSALASIGEQSLLAAGQCSIQVAIVDDSSPLPASDELANFIAPAGIEIVVKRQPNAGAGAARNSALAMLDEACDFVAFLDSDDTWTSDHLARAIQAMAAGADFYFSDAQRGEGVPSENSSLPQWFIENLHPIHGSENIYLYHGPADLAVVNGLMPFPSIVHRLRGSTKSRFPSRYFRFGEDQSYCLQYLAEGKTIAYSSSVEVLCGNGVNIFSGNKTGSENQRLCYIDEINFRKDALATLKLSDEARLHVQTKLAEASMNLLKQGLWQMRDDGGRWLARSLCAQPSLLLQLPRALRSWFDERHRLHRTTN